jgi:hypothetical protein
MTAAPTDSAGVEQPRRAQGVKDVDESIADVDMLRAVATGCAVGIPLVFVVLFVIDLVGGLDVPMAALAAAIPAVIFGAFIGSAYFIGRASDTAHARATAE